LAIENANCSPEVALAKVGANVTSSVAVLLLMLNEARDSTGETWIAAVSEMSELGKAAITMYGRETHLQPPALVSTCPREAPELSTTALE
jgi:hypothetical protein